MIPSRPTPSTDDRSETNSGNTLRKISSYTDPQGNTYCRREYIYLDMGKKNQPYTVAQIAQFKDYDNGLFVYITWFLRKRDVTLTSLNEVERERASQTTELPHLVTRLNSPTIKCRELFKCDKRDTIPVRMIVGKCLVMNYKNISEVASFVPEPDRFWVVHTYDANGRKLMSFNNKVSVGAEFQADVKSWVVDQGNFDDNEDQQQSEEVFFDGHECQLKKPEIDKYLELARIAIATLTTTQTKSPPLNHQQRTEILNGDEALNLALATLSKCKNNPALALERLADPKSTIPESVGPSFSLTLNFFSDKEIDKFQKGYKFSLNNPSVLPLFHVIKRDYLPHKSLADLVKFYYFWKKTPDGEVFRANCKQANAERGFIKSRSSVRRATERNRLALANSFKADDPPRVCGVCNYAENDKSAEFVTEAAVGNGLFVYQRILAGDPITPDLYKKVPNKKNPALICKRCYISFRKYDDFKCHDEPLRPGEVQPPTPTPPSDPAPKPTEPQLAHQDNANTQQSAFLSPRRVIKVRKEIFGGRYIQIVDGGEPICTRTDVIYNAEYYRRRPPQSPSIPDTDEPPSKRNRTDSDRIIPRTSPIPSSIMSTPHQGLILPPQPQPNHPIIPAHQLPPTTPNHSFNFHAQANNLDYTKCAAIADLLMYRAVTGGAGPQIMPPPHHAFGNGQPPQPAMMPQVSAMYYLKMAAAQSGNNPSMFMMGPPNSIHPHHPQQQMDTPALRHLSEIAAAGRLGMIGQQQQRPPPPQHFVPFINGPPPQQHDLSRMPGHYNMFPPPPPPPSAPPPQQYDPMSMLAAAAAGGRVPTPMVRPSSSTHNHAHVHAHSHTHLHLNDNQSTAQPPPGAFDAAALMRERDALMRLAIMAPSHSTAAALMNPTSSAADHSAAMALAAASAFRNPSQVDEAAAGSNSGPNQTFLAGMRNGPGGLALPAPPPQPPQNRPSSGDQTRR